MQPLKLHIEGDYFDCHLYSGRLYLWTFDCKLLVVDWNSLISSLIKTKEENIVLYYGFLDGGYWYNSNFIRLNEDEDIHTILYNKYITISQTRYVISVKDLERFVILERDFFNNSLPTDTEIYNDVLYYINYDGLFKSNLNYKNRTNDCIDNKYEKLWDCNLLSLKANRYPQLALSGGDEGLYEYNISDFIHVRNMKEVSSRIYRVSDNHSNFCNYNYGSIYNSSTIEKSFMAVFKMLKKEKERTNSSEKEKHIDRIFESEYSENEIFNIHMNGNHHLSWGSDEKITLVYGNKIYISRYFYKNSKVRRSNFEFIKEIQLEDWKGDVISGGLAFFANIIESENALILVLSDESIKPITLQGPITKWRVYPRSKNYENHLHVIYENEIVIYSFNHDYFIDQNNKNVGLEYTARENRYYKK